MVRQKETMWLKEQIAIQCAPLLAGLKPSNLLIIPKGFWKEVKEALVGTGFSVYCLSECAGKQVFLLYEGKELRKYLTEPKVQQLLWELGYEDEEMCALLQMVSEKYTAHIQVRAEFPHELGLLLGYPVVDVRGFMEHEGKDFLYSGYWKVYGNVRETVSLFREFRAAKEFAMQMVAGGYSIADTRNLYYSKKSYRLAVS